MDRSFSIRPDVRRQPRFPRSHRLLSRRGRHIATTHFAKAFEVLRQHDWLRLQSFCNGRSQTWVFFVPIESVELT